MLRKFEAQAILARCNVKPGEDFHRLESAKVEALLEEAKARGYREPKNANGSRARYFHAYLNRRATAAE